MEKNKEYFLSINYKAKVIKNTFHTSLNSTMAEPIIDPSQIGNLVWNSMPPEFSSSFSFLLTIGKAIGIAFLVYVIFMIIHTIIKTRQSLRIRSIEQNVSEINQKLDLLLHKKTIKPDKK